MMNLVSKYKLTIILFVFIASIPEISFPEKIIKSSSLKPDSSIAVKPVTPPDLKVDTSAFYLKKENYRDSLKTFIQRYGKNKRMNTRDSSINLAFFVALKSFPELYTLPIQINFITMKLTMEAQPKYNFLVKSQHKRLYKLKINKSKCKNGMNYNDLSFNAVVGWLGHELGHITNYSTMKNRSLLSFTIHYVLSKKYRKMIERQTDLCAIKHGLGYSLYEGLVYVLNNPRVSLKYKNKLREYYLSPQEIVAYIHEMHK